MSTTDSNNVRPDFDATTTASTTGTTIGDVYSDVPAKWLMSREDAEACLVEMYRTYDLPEVDTTNLAKLEELSDPRYLSLGETLELRFSGATISLEHISFALVDAEHWAQQEPPDWLRCREIASAVLTLALESALEHHLLRRETVNCLCSGDYPQGSAVFDTDGRKITWPDDDSDARLTPVRGHRGRHTLERRIRAHSAAAEEAESVADRAFYILRHLYSTPLAEGRSLVILDDQ